MYSMGYSAVTCHASLIFKTVIRRRRSEHIRLGDYSTIVIEPEENNCFSIITQVIIRATVFSFILFVSY